MATDPLEEDHPEESQPRSSGGQPGNPGTHLLRAIARFPVMIVVITMLGSFGALVAALSQPNTYTSVGLLLVRMGARERQTPETAVTPGLESRGSHVAAGDELLMLSNPALQRRVAAEVGAARILSPYDPSEKDDATTATHVRWVHLLQAWLMHTLHGPPPNLEAVPTDALTSGAIAAIANGAYISAQRNSNTIIVSYTAHNPELSRDVATAYVRVLQQRHREFYETDSSHSFVSERLDAAILDAETVRKDLLAMRRDDGVHDLEGSQQALVDENRDIVTQLHRDAIELESLAARSLVIEGQLRDETPWLEASADKSPPADDSNVPHGEDVERTDNNSDTARNYETLASLLNERQDVLGELAALERLFVKTSEQYRREVDPLKDRLASIDERIARQLEFADRSVPGSLPTPLLQPGRQVNSIYTELVIEQLENARQREALRTSITARTAVLEANRTELARLAALGPAHARLDRELAEKERYVAELEIAHTRSATLHLIDSDERMGSLLVTQEPFLPTDKDGPNRAKTLLMGLFGGAGLGLAMALARQLLDSRIRYPEDAERILGLRVIGVVPEQRSWRRAGKRLRSQMSRRS